MSQNITKKPLNGKIAVITGASRGIGRAIALELAADGADVVLCGRDAPLLDDASRAVEEYGVRAASIALDLRIPEAPQQLAEHAVNTFGGIDIVVNNAGATKRGEFLDLTEEDWSDGFALKFFGYVRLTRAAWPSLRTRKGSVVNIVGIGGKTPGAQFTIGGSVNAGILSFTKAVAELGIRDSVQVNAINPGFIQTDRLNRTIAAYAQEHGLAIDAARESMVRAAKVAAFGEPADIAGLVAFIVGPRGRFLQGALIDIDGGQTKSI